MLAVGLAILLPLAPVRMSTPSVQWPQVVTAPESTSLQLVNQTPRGLEVHFSCDTARAADLTQDGVLLATITPDQPVAAEQGLVVRVLDGRLLIDAVGASLLDTAVSEQACSYLIRSDGNELVVSRNDDEVARGNELPQIDVLATSLMSLPGADSEDLSVRVLVDDQMASSPTALKIAALVLMLLAAAVAIWAMIRLDVLHRRTIPAQDAADGPESTANRAPRQTALIIIDTLVIVVLICWVFLAPMTDDDGYYSAMARNAPYEGYVGNYYQLLNQNFTPFTWFYNALSFWQNVGNSAVILRIPALVCGVATWLLLRRFVLDGRALPGELRTGGKARLGALGVVAVVFLTWWMPYDMGVRPEAVVALLALATLSSVMAALEKQR